MTQKEYIIKLNALKAKRDAVNQEIADWRHEYINSVSKIPVNTKVIVNNAARFYSLFMSFFKRPQKFLKKSCFES